VQQNSLVEIHLGMKVIRMWKLILPIFGGKLIIGSEIVTS